MIEVGLVHPTRYDEIGLFYKKMGYGGGLCTSDSVLEARDLGRLVGVAKLSDEGGVLVLRGMYVEKASQRQGVGHQILEAVGRTIGSRECWCVPFAHLKDFYSRIGFSECTPESSPRFLGERFHRYRKLGHQVIIMKRAIEPSHGDRPD